MDEDIGVVYFVLTEDVLDGLLVESGKGFGTVKFDTAELGLGYVDGGGISVQPDTHFVQLSGDLDTLLFGFTGIQYH